MKTTYYNILYILFFIPAITFGNHGDKIKGKYTKEKSINKEFAVDSDALLKIGNDYGNVSITSWSENKVVLEINIKVNGNDEEKVIKKLKNIDVKFESSTQMVSAQTIFNKDGGSWWGKFTEGWGNSNTKMEINYTVKVPITNKLDLNNDYGSITLDKIEGNAKIRCDYGQIIIGDLLGDENYINIDYTHNSTIKYIKNGKINADYSDFTLEKAEKIQLNADYSKSSIKTVKELYYNCDYGDLNVQNVNLLKGNGDYLDTNIGDVGKELNINSDYGSIDIKNLKSTTNNTLIKTDYTGITIGYDSESNFDFILKTSYGGIKLDDSFNIMKKSTENTSKDYQGYRGEKNSGNTISISSNYGSIKIRNNTK